MNELAVNILQAVDGAHFVRADPDTELLFVWHGGTIVNIYCCTTGRNIDCFTIYGDAQGAYPTRYDIIVGIEDHLMEREEAMA